jgi:SAM-dependent methyltransferase
MIGNLRRRVYQHVHSVYYRAFFGRKMPLGRKLEGIVHAWERQQKLGDIPVSEDTWESQYLSGQWKYMMNLDELARYSVIVGYVSFLKPCGAILDVGCGEGILLRKLKPYGYSRYIGIEISKVALGSLTEIRDDKTSFVNADAEFYTPAAVFDVIIFNEVLCYFKEPMDTVGKYCSALTNDGILIVETYVNSIRSMSILDRLKRMYSLVDETRTNHVANSRAWICSVFNAAPREGS